MYAVLLKEVEALLYSCFMKALAIDLSFQVINVNHKREDHIARVCNPLKTRVNECIQASP